jgi:UDP-N-acetylmuramate dehydrogenase
MRIEADVPLAHCNTLRLPARAEWCATVASGDELREALDFARTRRLALCVLGGGSNVVLRERIGGCVLRMQLTGEELLEEAPGHVRVRVAAGVQWHGFVLACHRRGWHGLENLALIPGTVGAAPIQNIGAYGVEVQEFVEAVGAVDRASGEALRLTHADCRFAYRHSIFKSELAERIVITDLTLRLPRARAPRSDYPALRAALGAVADPSPADVLEAVMRIRRERLPDPAVLPNVGSFFKNPVIDRARFERLRAGHPGVVHWAAGDAVKLAAAWLVEQAGGKGMRQGAARVHERQALVLVNEGGATAAQVLGLASRIATAVRERFGIDLEIEPAVY